MNTARWSRCAQTNYKPNSTFFLWRGSNLCQFGAGASKPGAFNERMCSVMESAAFKPGCDALRLQHMATGLKHTQDICRHKRCE